MKLFSTSPIFLSVYIVTIYFVGSFLVNAKVNEDYAWSDSSFVTNMNSERASKNLSSLTESAELNRIAEQRLADMIEKNYFSHKSVTSSVNAYDILLASTTYDKKIRGENLAYGEFENENDVMKTWMNSKWHKYNILYRDFREVGTASAVADFRGGRYLVVVQVFGVKKYNIEDKNVIVTKR